ncbi:MAG: phosphoribosylanthranilate isomerase [Candidatus Omnitrophica bacterium]|nr:phosphoribosylanthranilate isomerase [Candidatus Omnitrophota bacterium]
MVKVKICGITNLEDAQAAADAGCDALGFVFYKESRRFISPSRVGKLVAQIPGNILRVGVFVDGKEKDIRWAQDLCRLDMLQFHGEEKPEFCDKFKDCKVIKAFRIRKMRDVRGVSRYDTYAYLFDTYIRGKLGGTGEKFDWELVKDFDRGSHEIFLSGGLNPKNIRQAIEIVKPDWVDASSSLEAIPAKKDHKKVAEFIKVAKS